MNEQKTAMALKEIFDRCGPEILRDNHRFESNLMDLWGKNFHCAERVALCHALDSTALLSLAEAPAITRAGAARTVARLEKECRLTANDAVFVTRCIISARGSDPDILPWPVPPRANIKRGWAVILCVLLVLGALACSVYCALRSAHYEELYHAESAQRTEAEQALETANAAISELRDDTLGSIQGQLEEAEQRQEELDQQLKSAQRQLNRAQDSLDVAQETLYKLGRGEFGYSSENFHADRGIITLNPNETGRFSVYGAYGYPTTYYLQTSDSTGLQSEWSQEWNESSTEVIVTALSPGSYVLTFTNDKNSETFDVLVVVPDA